MLLFSACVVTFLSVYRMALSGHVHWRAKIYRIYILGIAVRKLLHFCLWIVIFLTFSLFRKTQFGAMPRKRKRKESYLWKNRLKAYFFPPTVLHSTGLFTLAKVSRVCFVCLGVEAGVCVGVTLFIIFFFHCSLKIVIYWWTTHKPADACGFFLYFYCRCYSWYSFFITYYDYFTITTIFFTTFITVSLLPHRPYSLHLQSHYFSAMFPSCCLAIFVSRRS